MGVKNKIIGIILVVVVLILLGGLLGILLTNSKDKGHIELEVWPLSADNVIQYKSSDPRSWYPWVEKINNFLKDYRRTAETPGAQYRVICNPHTRLVDKQICYVPVEEFDPCTDSNEYNYNNAAPCVFLKLNKILDWKPQPYNSTVDLPRNMPEDLKQHIKMMGDFPMVNTVWVSCEGENPADVQNIGPVQYIPHHGFPSHYYPFTNKEGYLSPLVAVLFAKPRTGVVINIVCKSWAKNIAFEHGGSVHFKLMIDGE